MGHRDLTDWANPVTQVQPDWVTELLPYYECLVTAVMPYTADAMAARHWEQAKNQLDQQPEPTTPEAANKRWREFVGAVWWLTGKCEERWAASLAAARARRRT